VNTIDWQGRQHTIPFTLTPYYNSTKLSFAQAQTTLRLGYTGTKLYYDRKHIKTSGLDAESSLPAGYAAAADPVLPIANASYPHLSVDAEGLVLNADGT
jgi:hypothetical protein